MTEVITPADLNRELMRLSRQLDDALDDAVHWARESAETENTYRLAQATAMLTTSGSKMMVDERRAHQDKATGPERLASHTAGNMRAVSLKRIDAVRAQLSALQTVAGSVRAEIEMSGRYREGP